MRLTEVGTQVYNHAVKIIEQLEELNDAILQGEPHGLLRITSTFTIIDFALRPILAGFLRDHPQLDIELRASSSLDNFIEDNFDIALRAGALSGGSLIAKRFGKIAVGLFASPQYLENYADRLLHDSKPMLGLLRNKSGPSNAPAAARPRLMINDPFLLMGHVIAGIGPAWLPIYITKKEVDAGHLVRCNPDQKHDGGEIFALYSERAKNSSKVRAFLDYLSVHLRFD